MLHYGDPDWYERYVGPLRAAYRQDNKPQVSPSFSLALLEGSGNRIGADRVECERTDGTTTNID